MGCSRVDLCAENLLQLTRQRAWKLFSCRDVISKKPECTVENIRNIAQPSLDNWTCGQHNHSIRYKDGELFRKSRFYINVYR